MIINSKPQILFISLSK